MATPKTDIVLTFEGINYKLFSVRIASTKEETEAKVLAEDLVKHFTSIIKKEVVIMTRVEPTRFKEEK